MRCLGTLEFLCDFYDRCHLTQKELSETSNNSEEANDREENEAESDKENTCPPTNDTKRKTKVLSLDSTRSVKSSPTKDTVHCKTEMKDEDSNFDDTEKNDYAGEAQTLIFRRQSMVDDKTVINNILTQEKSSQNGPNEDSSLKCKNNLLNEQEVFSNRTTIRNTRSEVFNRSVNSEQEDRINNSIETEHPVRKKRGRKSKLEKMKEAASLAKRNELGTNSNDKKVKNFSNKRRCLRTICTNAKSNVTSNAVISTKPQTEHKEQVVLNAKSNSSIVNDCAVNRIVNTSNNDKEVEDFNNDSKKTEESCMQNKVISVIVKQEKVDDEIALPKEINKLNQYVWIPNDVLIENENGREDEYELELCASPLREDTDAVESSEDDCVADPDTSELVNTSACNNNEEQRPTVLMGRSRVSVIQSSLANGMTVSESMQDSIEELNDTIDTVNDESVKKDSKCDIFDQSLADCSSQDNSFNDNKSKDRLYGKVSQLISDEQKQAIETYYTVDMSMVNSDEVQKNLTVIDKKNIRCNICGTLYLRLDKCQVHIWGHLQMKPYQCKACDFSTVTVSNVRCHIRKSHLKIKPFACHFCEKRYVTAVLLEEHINTHTGARPYRCKLCDFASSSRQMLSYHTTTHKPVKDITCKVCGKEFYSRGRLRSHMIIHNKDKVFPCKICSAYLSNAEALEAHHKNVHMQDYVCNVCGKRVKSRKALHNHQNVHSAAKYKCSLCPNVYKSSQILKEHLLKHEGIRKYKCNICEKAFAQQSHLAAHMAVHSEIRFHCPGCNKAFNRHDNMKIHTKRCKVFLANPDLKTFLIKKEQTVPFKKLEEVTQSVKKEDIEKPVLQVNDQKEETEMKTVNDTQKTAMNICKLGLNISCIEPMNEAWTESNIYKEATDIIRSAEINVIQISNVNDKLLPETENLTVLENVLRPESF